MTKPVSSWWWNNKDRLNLTPKSIEKYGNSGAARSRESAALSVASNSNISKKSPCNPEIPSGEDELWNLEFVVWPSVFALISKCWWQSIINVGLSVSPSFFQLWHEIQQKSTIIFWKYYILRRGCGAGWRGWGGLNACPSIFLGFIE